MKDLNNWSEKPIDAIALSVRMLQSYYQQAFERGKAGIGNFSLKSTCIMEKIEISQLTLGFVLLLTPSREKGLMS